MVAIICEARTPDSVGKVNVGSPDILLWICDMGRNGDIGVAVPAFPSAPERRWSSEAGEEIWALLEEESPVSEPRSHVIFIPVYEIPLNMK